MNDLLNNVVCRNILLAGSLRSFGNMAISCYLPVFYQQVFPKYAVEYSLISASSLSILGFSSVVIGGLLS